MSVYIQMIESSFGLRITFIGCFTNREEFVFFFKLYDGLR